MELHSEALTSDPCPMVGACDQNTALFQQDLRTVSVYLKNSSRGLLTDALRPNAGNVSSPWGWSTAGACLLLVGFVIPKWVSTSRKLYSAKVRLLMPAAGHVPFYRVYL